jgi:phage terminase large subunit GpA-like protein
VSDDPVWQALDEVYHRAYPDAYGGQWPVDAFAVDSGYATKAVYPWCANRPKARAVKGLPGWNRAAIASSPTKVDIKYDGKRKRRGVHMWPVGTWPLKAEFYANLRKQGLREGGEIDPLGYCHFSDFHDEGYFRQITAETLLKRTVKGRAVLDWVPHGANHLHDCRVYNMALAAHLGIERLTVDDWARLASERGAPPPGAQGDLLSLASPVERAKAAMIAETPAMQTPEPPAARPKRQGGSFLSKRRM